MHDMLTECTLDSSYITINQHLQMKVHRKSNECHCISFNIFSHYIAIPITSRENEEVKGTVKVDNTESQNYYY